MIVALKAILVGVVGYLLGSANTSLIVGKFYGVDVRRYGSGNAGVTNTLRTLGKTAALFVLLGDILKGVIAALIGLWVLGSVEHIGQLGVMIGGIAAILGHNWPVYFGFKGGKGVLTAISVVMMMDPRIGLLLLGVFIIVVAITRYVSLGSITGAVLFPFLSLMPVFGHSLVFVFFAAFVGALVIYRHKSNIQRLVSGTEPKLGSKKKEF